jgi:hypothetical protein
VGPSTEPPTELELAAIRKEWRALTDALKAAGMAVQIGWPVKRKLMVYLLNVTGQPDAESVTRGQWDAFLEVTNKAVRENPENLLAAIESVLPAEAKTLTAVGAMAMAPQRRQVAGLAEFSKSDLEFMNARGISTRADLRPQIRYWN